jgi:hypothetical protein
LEKEVSRTCSRALFEFFRRRRQRADYVVDGGVGHELVYITRSAHYNIYIYISNDSPFQRNQRNKKLPLSRAHPSCKNHCNTATHASGSKVMVVDVASVAATTSWLSCLSSARGEASGTRVWATSPGTLGRLATIFVRCAWSFGACRRRRAMFCFSASISPIVFIKNASSQPEFLLVP